MKGYFAKKNTEPKKTLKEFRLENTENFINLVSRYLSQPSKLTKEG